MFFTMQENRQHTEECRQHAEECRQHAEERRQWMERMEKWREEDAARYERRRQEQNAFMERIFDTMMTRLVESLERIERRRNGNGNGTTND